MSIFRRLLGLLAPYSWCVSLAALLGAVTVASNVGLLGMAAYLIAASALKPLLVALSVPIFIVRFAGVARAASRYAGRLTGHSLTFHLLARLRSRVYRGLTVLVPSRLAAFHSGDLLTRLVADIDEIQHLYVRVVEPFLVAGLVAMLTSGLFALFSPVLAWTALAFLVASGIGVPLLSRRLSQGIGKRQLRARAELNARLVDGIQGVQDILALGQETAFQRRIAEQGSALARMERRMAFVSGLEQGLHDLVTSLAVWTILLLAIPLVTAQVVGGIYLAFLALVLLASFEPIEQLAPALRFLGRTLAAGQRVFDMLEQAPVVTDPVQPLLAPTAPHTGEPVALSLAFEHVTFTYLSDFAAQDNALTDVSFSVPAGDRIAIVGPSGAGKSTLARLAVRFYDPTSGAIRLDGADIRRYGLCDLRAAIGVVAQDTYIFNDTLRRNLLLARPEATDDELYRALGQAQLDDFVRQLPQGLETWAGEQGMRLSGGERQRLAVARALLKDAPVLILDEPTANLDPQTERELLDTLDTALRGRTTLMITHRLCRMERMDEIIVLDAGRVVERGTHARLLREDGLYRRLLGTQNSMLALASDNGEATYG